MRRRVRLASAVAAALLALVGCSSGDDPDAPADPAGRGTGGSGEGDLVEVPGVLVDADSAAFLSDALRIVVPCDGDLCLWTSDGRFADRLDGGGIVATSGPGIYTDRIEDGTVELVLLDPASGEEIGSVDAYEADDVQDDPGQGMRDLAFSPDGKWVAGVGADGVVRRWTASGLSDELTIESGGDAVAAAFSPDGSMVAVASADAPVTIHDTSTGAQVGELDAPPQGAVEWSDDGWLATASFALDDEAATTIWNAETREVEATLPRPGHHLAFAEPGTLLLTVKDELDVLRWDWERDDVRTYAGASDAPRAILHSRTDARIIAVSPRDGVLAWEVAGGEPTVFDEPEE